MRTPSILVPSPLAGYWFPLVVSANGAVVARATQGLRVDRNTDLKLEVILRALKCALLYVDV